MLPALVALIPLLKAAAVGAAVGGVGNKMAGGSFKKGALMGAGVGAGGAGLSSLLAAPAAAGAAGGAASDAMTAGLSGSAAAGAEPALAAGAGKAATAGSMSSLLKQAAINTGVQTAAGMAMPQHGMTQIGNVPQMEQPDVSAELQQLMQKSMAKKGRV